MKRNTNQFPPQSKSSVVSPLWPNKQLMVAPLTPPTHPIQTACMQQYPKCQSKNTHGTQENTRQKHETKTRDKNHRQFSHHRQRQSTNICPSFLSIFHHLQTEANLTWWFVFCVTVFEFHMPYLFCFVCLFVCQRRGCGDIVQKMASLAQNRGAFILFEGVDRYVSTHFSCRQLSRPPPPPPPDVERPPNAHVSQKHLALAVSLRQWCDFQVCNVLEEKLEW